MKHPIATTKARELLSALADGQVTDVEYALALEACNHDLTLIAEWSTYHLIGDVLRSSAPAARGANLAFVDQISQRVAFEAVKAGNALTIGSELPTPSVADTSSVSQFEHRYSAANDASFRWKMAAGFASLAAVCAIAWSAFGSLVRTDAPQLAFDAGTEQILVSSPQGPVFRDPRLDELLADHRQLGSASVLQMPSGFLRNAAFEVPQNGGR